MSKYYVNDSDSAIFGQDLDYGMLIPVMIKAVKAAGGRNVRPEWWYNEGRRRVVCFYAPSDDRANKIGRAVDEALARSVEEFRPSVARMFNIFAPPGKMVFRHHVLIQRADWPSQKGRGR